MDDIRRNTIQDVCQYLQGLPYEIAQEEDPDFKNRDLRPILEHLMERVTEKVWERFVGPIHNGKKD